MDQKEVQSQTLAFIQELLFKKKLPESSLLLIMDQLDSFFKVLPKDSIQTVVNFLYCLSNLSCTTVKLYFIRTEIMKRLFDLVNTSKQVQERAEALRCICNFTHGLEIIPTEESEDRTLLIDILNSKEMCSALSWGLDGKIGAKVNLLSLEALDNILSFLAR